MKEIVKFPSWSFPESLKKVEHKPEYPDYITRKPKKIIPFRYLPVETVEKKLNMPDHILLCWRYDYDNENIIRAVYMPIDGEIRGLVLYYRYCFNEDLTQFGDFSCYTGEKELAELREHWKDGNKIYFSAPRYLLDEPDRRQEYLTVKNLLEDLVRKNPKWDADFIMEMLLGTKPVQDELPG